MIDICVCFWTHFVFLFLLESDFCRSAVKLPPFSIWLVSFGGGEAFVFIFSSMLIEETTFLPCVTYLVFGGFICFLCRKGTSQSFMDLDFDDQPPAAPAGNCFLFPLSTLISFTTLFFLFGLKSFG